MRWWGWLTHVMKWAFHIVVLWRSQSALMHQCIVQTKLWPNFQISILLCSQYFVAIEHPSQILIYVEKEIYIKMFSLRCIKNNFAIFSTNCYLACLLYYLLYYLVGSCYYMGRFCLILNGKDWNEIQRAPILNICFKKTTRTSTLKWNIKEPMMV